MDEIDEALRLADALDLDDGQWIVDTLAAEVRRLREMARRARAVDNLNWSETAEPEDVAAYVLGEA